MRFKSILLSLTVTVIFVLCHVSSDTVDYFYPNDKNCGKTEEIPGDPRTQSPWTVAIFARKNLRSPFRYFLTGSLGSSTTVMTTFGGSYGQPSFKNANRSYYIASPSHFLVVAGLRSTDLNDADEFTQMANVSYILPHNGNFSGSEEYHLVMFRLASPMNLETPYVRSICQPYGVVPALHALGYKGRYSDILSYARNIEPSFINGFNGPLNETGPQKLSRFSVTSSNDALCLNTYKYYYRSQPDEIFCLIINPGEGVSESTCMGHGSLKTFKPRPETVAGSTFFHPELRFYSSGFVTLIPRRDRGQCDIHTVYHVHSMFASSLEWVKLNMICTSRTYPCHDGKCIPLDKVCDGKADCSAGEDEDPVYCKATNRCKKRDAYQCGLEGKCISSSQVGDGVEDCPSGSDEFPEVIAAKTSSPKKFKSGSQVSCAAVQPPKGVTATCSHPQLGEVDCSKSPPGTQMVMSCSKHYKPLSRTNLITMKCYDDKAWKPYRTFSCQPECGQVPKNSSESTAQKDTLLPWNARIVIENSDGIKVSKCGGSLIERNIIITAAHCLTDEKGEPFEPSELQVTLNSSPSEDLLFPVGEIRIPKNYDPETLQSDIAIIKLTKPVTYSDTVKPICYLMNKFARSPLPDSSGIVPTSVATKSDKTWKQGKNLDLVVLLDDQCDSISSDSFCAKSSEGGVPCAGISGSGLVFPVESDEDMVTYLLKGVFQSVEGQDGCERDSGRIYGLTHLDDHTEWILLNLQNITNTAF